MAKYEEKVPGLPCPVSKVPFYQSLWAAAPLFCSRKNPAGLMGARCGLQGNERSCHLQHQGRTPPTYHEGSGQGWAVCSILRYHGSRWNSLGQHEPKGSQLSWESITQYGVGFHWHLPFTQLQGSLPPPHPHPHHLNHSKRTIVGGVRYRHNCQKMHARGRCLSSQMRSLPFCLPSSPGTILCSDPNTRLVIRQ